MQTVAEAVQEIWAAWGARQFAAAPRLARKAVERFPNSDECHAMLAFVLLGTVNPEESQKALKEVSGSGILSICVQAEIQAHLGNIDRAIELAETALSMDATHWSIGIATTALVFAGRCREAEATLIRLQAAYPKDLALYDIRVTLYRIALADSKGFAEFLNGAPDWYRKSSSYWFAQGSLAMSRWNHVRAEKCFRVVLKLNPEDAGAWSQLAVLLNISPRKGEAAEAAERALALNPCSGSALSVLASMADLKGDAPAARDYRNLANNAVPALRSALEGEEWAEAERTNDAERKLAILSKPPQRELPLCSFVRKRVLINTLLAMRQFGPLTELVDEVESNYEICLEAILARVSILNNSQRLDQALQVVEQGLCEYPHAHDLMACRADILLAQGKIKRGIAQAQRIPAVPVRCGILAARAVNHLWQANLKDVAEMLLIRAEAEALDDAVVRQRARINAQRRTWTQKLVEWFESAKFWFGASPR